MSVPNVHFSIKKCNIYDTKRIGLRGVVNFFADASFFSKFGICFFLFATENNNNKLLLIFNAFICNKFEF